MATTSLGNPKLGDYLARQPKQNPSSNGQRILFSLGPTLERPSISRARTMLMTALVSRGAPQLAQRVHMAQVVLCTGSDGLIEEEFRDAQGPIARIDRGGFMFVAYAVYVTWLAETVGQSSETLDFGQPGAASDLFAALYKQTFTNDPQAPTVAKVDNFMRIRLALELCDATALGELDHAMKTAVRDPEFYVTTVLTIGIYVGLWLTPDPTMVTKIAAGALTVFMLAMFTWSDILGFCAAWLDLSSGCESATTEEQLKAAGDAFLAKLGQVGFDVFLMLLFHGVEKGAGPKVRAGARTRAAEKAAKTVDAARQAPGSGYEQPGPRPGESSQPHAESVTLLNNAKATAGNGAKAGQVLDALRSQLPNQRAKRGLADFRAKVGDEAALKAAEGTAKGGKSVARWAEELGMTKEEKTAARDERARAEADLALKEVMKAQEDPALNAQAKRASWIRNLLVLLRALLQSHPRLAGLMKAGDLRAVTGVLGEVLARAALKQRTLPGQEVRGDLELARKVPGNHKSIGDWHRAAKARWDAGGRVGPEPRPERMRTYRNAVWESLGQADNAIIEVGSNGKASIKVVEETKTGNESAADASAQVGNFIENLGKIGDGSSDARMFTKEGAHTLGTDVTDSYDLSNARSAQAETRGVQGRTGFTSNLPVDRPALESAAQQAINGRLWEVMGPPLESGDHEP